MTYYLYFDVSPHMCESLKKKLTRSHSTGARVTPTPSSTIIQIEIILYLYYRALIVDEGVGVTRAPVVDSFVKIL